MYDKETIDKLVTQWLEVDINPRSRDEIKRLQKDGNYKVLDSKLSKRIAFGTAGLRSSMQSGFAHMNDVTILQAAQGLISYLEKNGGDSIVIGYDHRFNSQRYAEITASVALVKGFKVYYLGTTEKLSKESLKLSNTKGRASEDDMVVTDDRSYVHTPMVPFAIDYYGASAGVMVTASHNPANDNGYKVYYGNGCQIIPPIDHDIALSIGANLSPWCSKVWDIVGNFQDGANLISEVKSEVTKVYVEKVGQKLLKSTGLDFEFVYTPMHGVGGEIFDKVVDLFDNGVSRTHTVPKQARPDPTFSTVSFPNPEEKGALDLAIKTADENDVKLVVANDPDADRFSVAVKMNGEWKQLTGNEIGFLFAMYVISETAESELSNTYLVNSTVSSQILSSMAAKEGFKFEDTLTGFKWIGNKALDLKKNGFNVPFGYEEAIGFMFDLVNDKDGISAAVMWLQLYNKWFSSGDITPLDKLKEGYEKYGFSKECNGYYKLTDLGFTPRIFNEIRESYAGSDYTETIGPFKVDYWRDLTVGYESGTKDGKSILPMDANSQMITAVLSIETSKKPENTNKPESIDPATTTESVRFTCRGSGTEPKLKVYIEGKGPNEESASLIAKKCWNTLKEEWFQPQKNKIKEVLNE